VTFLPQTSGTASAGLFFPEQCCEFSYYGVAGRKRSGSGSTQR
jgi:hypothetical protein